MADLLYEIGTEEIPAGYIGPALAQLAALLTAEMECQRLTHGQVYVAATPRRLTVAVENVADRQPDSQVEVIGPPFAAAFDDRGNPTKAALGFARSQGVDPGQIIRKETPRGPYCCVRKSLKGRPAIEVLAQVLPSVTVKLSFPKSMLWPGTERPFARPVRTLVALFGREVIPFRLFGVQSDRVTEGHPFLDGRKFKIPDADFNRYKALLREHMVIVDFDERKAMVRSGIESALREFGGTFREEALLDEVANLVQYPSVTLASFERAYLELPAPVIEAAMMEHQRYFPVRDASGRLCPRFIVVSDRAKDGTELIRRGNEQVLRARLADAQFFDMKDRQTTLEQRIVELRGVAFLKGLGSYYDKTLRLEKLVCEVARNLGFDEATMLRAARAACLCKADLLTEMVGEFPALQGEVGRIYALREGEPDGVAAAIAEHYLPRSAEGKLPGTPEGRALSLAEKLDNLVSCFALDLVPTGSADPYALRRQAAGLIRIVADAGRHFQISPLLRLAQSLLPEPYCRAEAAVPKLLDFLRDRLFQMALDRDLPHDLINAALAPGFDDICDFWLRLDTLRELSREQCWQDLVTAVERTGNISRAAPFDGLVSPALFTEPLERELWDRFQAHAPEIEQLQAARHYAEAARRYAGVFAASLHEFFEKVFVNVEDERVRNNRLLLLKQINRLFSARIADLSQIVTGTRK